jgi:pyruvate ferredoxin oxidoreductase gamma subunit
MQGLVEIRWHGRGGQGAVTAAKLVAEAALEQGKCFQAAPEYGAERQGAPIVAYTRIADEPITIHCAISEPDIVMVLDDTLLAAVNVADGLKPGGTIIVNTTKSPESIKAKLGLGDAKVVTVDATGIAVDTIKRPIPNTPMLGALCAAGDIMDVQLVMDHVKKSLGKKFSDEVVEGNVAAVRRACEEAKSA